MTAFDEDFLWHQKELIIVFLAGSPLSRKALYKRLKHEQPDITTPFGSGLVHSESSYQYRINELKSKHLIEESEKTLRLRPLGQWIACSKLGTVFERLRFMDFICSNCDNPPVLCVLLRDTEHANSKGVYYRKILCPRCGHLDPPYKLGIQSKKDSFIGYYNNAVKELTQKMQIEAHVI